MNYLILNQRVRGKVLQDNMNFLGTFADDFGIPPEEVRVYPLFNFNNQGLRTKDTLVVDEIPYFNNASQANDTLAVHDEQRIAILTKNGTGHGNPPYQGPPSPRPIKNILIKIEGEIEATAELRAFLGDELDGFLESLKSKRIYGCLNVKRQTNPQDDTFEAKAFNNGDAVEFDLFIWKPGNETHLGAINIV